MSKDIIADNQTAAAISKLRRGEATDALRDEVSAALLTTMQDVTVQLGEIRKSLWTPQDLRNAIDERHKANCGECTARKWVEAQIMAANAAEAARKTETPRQDDKKPHPFLELVRSEGVRYFVLVLILIWAIVYVKTGIEGVEAVRDAAVGTMTGGQK